MPQTKWHTCVLLMVAMPLVLSDGSGSEIPVLVVESRARSKEPHLPLSIYSREGQNGRMMYTLDLQSVNGSTEFCVANPNADPSAVQTALSWACGTTGGADCSAIQPGQACYNANSLMAVASYAFNDYYQRTKANGGTCSFNNIAELTPNDPSSGSCIFTGSTENGSNAGGGSSSSGNGSGSNTGNNSSTGGSIVPTSFGPSSFDNAAYKLRFPNPFCLLFPLILLSCLVP